MLGAGHGARHDARDRGHRRARCREAKQGVASAVNDAAREVGGALGIAVLGSVLADHVGRLGPGMDPTAFVDGFSAALLVGAGVLAAGALIVAWRAPSRHERPAADIAAPSLSHSA